GGPTDRAGDGHLGAATRLGAELPVSAVGRRAFCEAQFDPVLPYVVVETNPVPGRVGEFTRGDQRNRPATVRVRARHGAGPEVHSRPGAALTPWKCLGKPGVRRLTYPLAPLGQLVDERTTAVLAYTAEASGVLQNAALNEMGHGVDVDSGGVTPE